MKSLLLRKGTVGISIVAMALSVTLAVHAQDAATTVSAAAAAEQIVALPTDTPLERQAKLVRAWTLFREKGSTQIWAITKENKKREVKTLAFFTAFDANYLIKLVQDGRLDGFTTGDSITSVEGLSPEDFLKAPPMCRLLRTKEQPAVYLVCGGQRQVILREGVFHQFGWEFRDVETVTATEINSLKEASALDEQTVFDERVEVQGTEERQLRERLTERLNLQGKTQVRARLVKPIGRPEVYVITPDGVKHRITNIDAARAHKLNLQQTTEVTADEITAFPEGAPITASASDEAVLNQTVKE